MKVLVMVIVEPELGSQLCGDCAPSASPFCLLPYRERKLPFWELTSVRKKW